MMNVRSFSLLISLSLLIGPLPLSAMLSEGEHIEYMYLDRSASNLDAIVSVLSSIDDDGDSPLHQLKKHLEDGFIIGESDAILEVLEYAELLLQKNYKRLGEHAQSVAHD